MTACELPNCASVVCAAVCHAGLPLVILKLLVNIVATPFYFLLRMFQYQHVAEQRSWCVMPPHSFARFPDGFGPFLIY